jgi:glycosyltransferase involved in cell wall biosynthesis
MYLSKTIAVVIPAYNEESQIGKTLATMPSFVDYVAVVNDGSTDSTANVVTRMGATACDCRETIASNLPPGDGHPRIFLIHHGKNRGCGAAMVSGYRWCLANSVDIAVSMDGDGQMDPANLQAIISPVAIGETDCCKGNRLFSGEAWRIIPRVRYLGNSVLSLLTKIASGYWNVADSQCGYRAISRSALEKLPLDKLYPRFGYPNHILVMLNIFNLKVLDVPVRPVYNQGEKSKIRLYRVIPAISILLFKQFLWRIKEKYIIRDFHPLVFHYLLSALLFSAGFALFVRLVWLWIANGYVPSITALALGFCVITGLQSAFFGMWLDMDYNSRSHK